MMRIVYLTLSLALFGTLASADWDEDERCKDRRRAFDPNEPDMRLLGDDLFKMGEKVVTKNHDVTMQSGKASSNIRGSAPNAHRKLQEFTTMLKMYWKLGYCWQDEYERERMWCMGCEGSTCQEDDYLWLKRCDEEDLEQRFVLEMVEDAEKQMMKIKPSTDTDLCWTRTGDNAHTLQKCGNDFLDASGHDKQAIIVGFDNEADCEGDECFELHPNGRSEDSDCEDSCPLCLNNHRHPNHYEVIRAEPCEAGRDYKNTLWELYGSEGTLMNLFASSFETAMPSNSSASSTTPPPIPSSDYETASSVPPDSPAPTTTPPLVGVPTSDDAFKVSPPTPPPDTTAATCLIGISIRCTADEVECTSYRPPSGTCLKDSTYEYTFENLGPLNAFDFTEGMSQLTGKSVTDLTSFFAPMPLQPGQTATILEMHRIDYCQTTEISAAVKVTATSTGVEGSICSVESAYSFIAAQDPIRRILGGT